MIKSIATIIFICTTVLSNAQTDNKPLARVKKINGVEAYIMCEPLRDYTTVVDVNTGIKVESVASGGLVNKTISGRVEQFINRAKDENDTIDAIVYTTGKRVVGVRFKTTGTPENIGIGRATILKGNPVFVMCEPLTPYEILESKKGGTKWKSLMSAGLLNNSIDEDVEKIVNRLEDVDGVQAYYFDGSKEGEAIKFK